MFPNFKVPLHNPFASGTTTTTQDITATLRAGLSPNDGQIAFSHQNGLHLAITEQERRIQWIEVVVPLDSPDWLACHALHLSFQAQSDCDTEVSTALRLYRGADFQDIFSAQPAKVGQAHSSFGAQFTLSPRQLADVTRSDLHLFLTPKAQVFTLLDLAVTGMS